jgi:signal transduction histidine kinase
MPIAVSVVLDEDDFLGAWRQSRMKDIGFLALFTIFGSILSFFAVIMARQIMRVEESEGAAILASQAKSEFLANMSHELRTPLNAIIGFSEMINSGYFGPLNAKQKERIHDINLCGSHLLQLITDILEFSKGDAGKLELIEEKVDLGELIDEATRIMSGKIRTKGISMVVAVDPQLPLLWGDKRKIRQILINLLSNSFKFTPEEGTITISARADQFNNIALVVADSGIGISEDDIPKALSVFGQVHRTKSHEGTGLGLPLCKMYAELHDGKLLLTSKIGQGTNVKIIFPHQRALPSRAMLAQSV